MSSDLINRVTDILLETGAVPLPGGHGVWFPEVRERYPLLTEAPGTVARCYVCLVLLGRGGAEEADLRTNPDEVPPERWNRKEWWLHATAWFDVYCPQLAVSKGSQRWEIMLEAMVEAVHRWAKANSCSYEDLWDHVAGACAPEARRLLRDLTKETKRGSTLSARLIVPAGPPVSWPEERWRLVLRAFEDRAEDVELLYFLHTFHASLGIKQYSPDIPYPNRQEFYRKVKAILDCWGERCEGLREAATRIGERLGATRVVAASYAQKVSLDPLAMSLPPCFQYANCRTRPPLREQVRRRLVGNPNVSRRLLEAHDLAEALADRAMDILRFGEADGFDGGDYSFFDNQFRDGTRTYNEQARRGSLAPVESGLTEEGPAFAHPMTKPFAERMAVGLVPELARDAVHHPRGKSKDRGDDSQDRVIWSEAVEARQCVRHRSGSSERSL